MLVETLDHVHSKKIVMRDLNSNSINLREKGKPGFGNKPLIVNFEDCCKADDYEYLSMRMGTVGYIAPEVLQVNFNSQTTDFYKADIFSLGVIMYQLMSNENPFIGVKEDELYLSNLNCQVKTKNQQFDSYSDTLKSLVFRMLSPNP